MSQPRISDYPIDAQFIERWSPRAMTNDAIDDQTLLSFFEAARWSPSAYNIQPWRFAYSKHGSDSWENYLEFLIDFNRGWAQHASALVVIVSKTTSLNGERLVDNPTHAFDTGAAWANLAHQAHLKGWLTHCMSGIHHDKIVSGVAAAGRLCGARHGGDRQAGRQSPPAGFPAGERSAVGPSAARQDRQRRAEFHAVIARFLAGPLRGPFLCGE